MKGANKKGKKNKGTVLSLTNFLGDAPQGTINVVKKISTNSGELSDGDESTTTAVVLQLPTAPKAKRIFDDDSIPHKAPFLVRISNLPFDANEDDVYDLFGDVATKSVTLPRDEGETGRLRGFGKVELENRDDLIHMLSLPEPTMRGRRIRIELFNQAEYAGNRMGGGGDEGNRRRYNNFGDTDANRESTNWRQDSAMGAAAYSGRESTAWRRNSPEASTSRNAWNQRSYREDDNRGASNWRQESSGSNAEAGGSWRTGNNARSGDSNAWRDNGDGNRRRNYTNRYGNSPPRDRNWQRRNSPTEESQQGRAALHDDERPRLKLLPRQLPLPKIVTNTQTTVNDDATLNQDLNNCEITSCVPTETTAGNADADSGHDSDDAVITE